MTNKMVDIIGKGFPDFIEEEKDIDTPTFVSEVIGEYKGSEEVCKCGKPLGTGKDCSYCKQFAESKTLGEHKK